MIQTFPAWSITKRRPVLSGAGTTPSGDTNPSAIWTTSTFVLRMSSPSSCLSQLVNNNDREIKDKIPIKRVERLLRIGCRFIFIMINLYRLIPGGK
jgi:hypothetical protein